jgi:hypothetical protein
MMAFRAASKKRKILYNALPRTERINWGTLTKSPWRLRRKRKKRQRVRNGMAFEWLLPTTKTFIMGGLLYLIAVVLVIAWAIGLFAYHAPGIIHLLLVIAVIVILLKVIRRAD